MSRIDYENREIDSFYEQPDRHPDDLAQENSKLRQDLDEARNEILFKESQLNSQRKLAKSMEVQNKTQSTRIARLEDTIRDLKEQIETLRANPTASAISAVDETALEDLKAEIRELKGENEAMRENEDRARREFEELERRNADLVNELSQKQREIQTLRLQPPERSMVKSVARKDEGSEKDAKIQSQIKEIAVLKEEAKKGSELESKLRTAEAALSESNKVRDGLRSRCKELEEELKQAKKAAGGERIIGDSYAIPESAGTIHSENEGEGDSAYNPHKKVLDSIFGYAEQVHETKEKLRFLNYVTYIAETKLEEMYSAAFDY